MSQLAASSLRPANKEALRQPAVAVVCARENVKTGQSEDSTRIFYENLMFVLSAPRRIIPRQAQAGRCSPAFTPTG